MIKFNSINGHLFMTIRDKWGGIYEGPVNIKNICNYMKARKMMKAIAACTGKQAHI